MDLWDYIFIGVITIVIAGVLIASVIGYNTPEKYKVYQEGNVTIVERVQE
jgi:hypothetical protein